MKGNLELWQDYMVARRILEKRGQGFEVFPQEQDLPDYLSDEKLQEFIDEQEAQHPEFAHAILSGLRSDRVAGGTLSPPTWGVTG